MTGDAAIKASVIIEDDLDIRSLLEVILSQAGFATTAAETGNAGVAAVRETMPDVVILDVGLPDIDGFEVVRRIREFSRAYVLMLTARDDEIDVLHGLSAGADTYITKPFRPRELRARIDALMRRATSAAGTEDTSGHPAAAEVEAARAASSAPALNPQLPASRLFAHNGLHVDIDVRTAHVDGVNVVLTRTEFDLLASLVESGRRVRTKTELAMAMRRDASVATEYVSDADRRTVEAHLGNLRRKLGDSHEDRRFIETVRGVGYRLTESR